MQLAAFRAASKPSAGATSGPRSPLKDVSNAQTVGGSLGAGKPAAGRPNAGNAAGRKAQSSDSSARELLSPKLEAFLKETSASPVDQQPSRTSGLFGSDVGFGTPPSTTAFEDDFYASAVGSNGPTTPVAAADTPIQETYRQQSDVVSVAS